MKTVNRNGWERFINKWYGMYLNDRDKMHLAHYTVENFKTIRITNVKTGKSAVSKCNSCDKFDYRTGTAVAYAKLRGCEIPHIVEDE